MKITSSHNPRFRAALALKASRGRRRADRFLIYGQREIERALDASHLAIDEAFLCSEYLSGVDEVALRERLRARGASLLDIDSGLFDGLAFGDRLDGVVALARRPPLSLCQIAVPDEALVVVGESLEKPGNLGALARVCDGAGVDALILANPHTDFFHPHAIRSSMGAVFALNLAAGPTDEVLAWLREHRFKTYGATPQEHALVYSDCDLTGRAAVAFGTEAEGLSAAWFGSQVTPIRLPMRGVADSLNLSTAAAVVVYESLRQRGAPNR